MKVSELEGAELDYWAAMAVGANLRYGKHVKGFDEAKWRTEQAWGCVFQPSSDWHFTGPLIEKYKIELRTIYDFTESEKGQFSAWSALWFNSDDISGTEHGDTPQQAICRAVVASVYGDEVDD